MNFGSHSWEFWLVAAVVFVAAVIIGALLVSVALRKLLGGRDRDKADDFGRQLPKTESESAAVTASMQAVIRQLQEQEKGHERLHREEKTRAHQTERITEAVTRTMPTGLLLVNATGLIQTANPAAETALGRGALSFHRYSEALGADSALSGLLTACLREGRTFQREEVEHRTANGEVRHLGVTISPTAAEGRGGVAQGRPGGALCLLSDLTELTALQKQVRLQENMAALGEMSAGIAHEFKNALAIISGYAQMIRGDAPAGEMAESADRILKETRALTHVVTEFLRFARPLELSPESVDLGALLEKVARETSQAIAGVRVRVDGEFREVSGDEGLLRQALLNLARNAAEAAAGHAAAPEVILRGSIDSGWQRIAVADNGSGIPAESLSKVFLPFYTTKSNGTGLGLAVVQKIALQHGGRVEAANQPGGGAEFILWLPLPSGNPQAVDSAPERI